MAEWGKYLKNAVANVEQQLDRVLLENQDAQHGALPNKSRTRPDLSERLKLAATGKTDTSAKPSAPKTDETIESNGLEHEAESEKSETRPQSTEDTSEAARHVSSVTLPVAPEDQELIDLLTLKEFVDAPSLDRVVSEARKVALLVKRDDMLALVDNLEQTDRDLNAYTKNNTERLQSIHSKLAMMCNQQAKVTQGPEQQVALLMEEGQRLSQQELKLNLLVRKLRGELRDSQSQLKKHADQGSQIEKLNQEIHQLRTQNRELEALVANYRALLNEAPTMTDNSDSSKSKTSPDEDLQKYVIDRENWHRLETQLLKRISELEQSSSLRHKSTSQLQQNLVDAQRQSREAQDQIVELQDELDAVKLNSKHELDALRQELASLNSNKSVMASNNPPNLIKADQTISYASDPENDYIKDSAERSMFPVAEAANPNNDTEQLSPTSSPVVRMPPEIKLPSSLPVQSTFYAGADASPGIVEHDPFTLIPDEQTVGPSGPFGGADERDSVHILDADDGLYGIENEEPSLVSRQSIDSLSLWGNRSRQDSAVNSLNEGANSHLIKKLTLSVRRLQNDLSAAKQEAQSARQQRQEAQAEIVKYIHLQEEFNSLQSSYSQLAGSQKTASEEIERLQTQLNDKSEIVDELKADIRDLKDMYRDQVETLISEIEKLKH